MPDPIAELYREEPEAFVAARDALARRLRAEGDAAGAAAVRALRRPPVPAYLLNLVAVHDPALVDRVRGAGADLREAQAAAVREADGTRLRELAQTRREVVDAVVRAALGRADAHGREVSAAHRESIASTAEAALSDEGLAREWAGGRLAVVRAAAGFHFDQSQLDATSEQPAARPSTPREPTARKPAASVKTVTRRSVAPATRQASPATDDTARDSARLRAAAESARRLRAEAETARAAAEAARDSWRAADRAAKEARVALREAERAAGRADLRAATAEQAVWEAGERSRGGGGSR